MNEIRATCTRQNRTLRLEITLPEEDAEIARDVMRLLAERLGQPDTMTIRENTQ